MKQALDDIASKAMAHVNVGFLAGSTCGEHGEASAPEIAFYNEFGTTRRLISPKSIAHESLHAIRTEHIPPRPFFRNMISKRSKRWGKLIAKLLKKYKFNYSQAMAAMGQVVSEELQQSIVNFSSPKNAPSTIARKGFDKPLVDSGNLMRAVNYEVIDGSA